MAISLRDLTSARGSYVYRQALLRVLKSALELRAKLLGKRFRCLTLAGEVRDGIFVNSDMTVSCNCQDVDGTGIIGDLRTTPFEAIFEGPRATAFRQALAAGHLPVSRCPACFHLRMVPVAEAEAQLTEFRLPKGLSVENTVLCNLRCSSCCRREVMRIRRNLRMTLEAMEIVARTLSRLGLNYCGFYNLGEPFISNTILSELKILREHNPHIRIVTSTNGLLLDTNEKREAALLMDVIFFSMDGMTTAMVRRYQRGGDFERAYQNLKELVTYGNRRGMRKPQIVWKYVVFRWNDSRGSVNKAVELAREAGADTVLFTFARNPVHGISLPFLLPPFYRRLGIRQGWRSRVVQLAGRA